MNKLWIGLLLFVLGAAFALGLSRLGTNKQIAGLKARADSIAAYARHVDSVAQANHDSVAIVRAKLDQVEHAAETRQANAETRVGIFHDALHRLADTNTVLIAAIDSLEAAHAEQVQSLKDGKAAADAKVLILSGENVALLGQVHDLSGQIQSLNAQIQKLNHHRLPGWARTGFEIARTGLAIKGGVDLVNGK